MFVMGGGVAGGLHGTYPSLTDLTNGDLRMQVDFRRVYASVLENWLNVPSSGILGGTFSPLALFAPPVNCTPRPPVRVTTSAAGGRLQATLVAGGGLIREVRFGPTQNGKVDVGPLTERTGTFTYRPTTAAAQITFSVGRVAAGPTTIPIVVVDDCGDWTSFVGGGATAF
jgi:hypothetical protein